MTYNNSAMVMIYLLYQLLIMFTFVSQLTLSVYFLAPGLAREDFNWLNYKYKFGDPSYPHSQVPTAVFFCWRDQNIFLLKSVIWIFGYNETFWITGPGSSIYRLLFEVPSGCSDRRTTSVRSCKSTRWFFPFNSYHWELLSPEKRRPLQSLKLSGTSPSN